MKGTEHEVACQSEVYNYHQVERCVRYAFELARKRHSKENPWRGLSAEDIAAGKTAQLTLCGKSNVLTYVFDLWERVFYKVAEEFPEVKTAYCHVDATTMWMVKNPEWFDVIVTNNIFGDIITDLGAMTQGGMGIAAGGNLNPTEGGVSMFEPIGGSAPKYTGMTSSTRWRQFVPELCCWISSAKKKPPLRSKSRWLMLPATSSKAWRLARWVTAPPKSVSW